MRTFSIQESSSRSSTITTQGGIASINRTCDEARIKAVAHSSSALARKRNLHALNTSFYNDLHMIVGFLRAKVTFARRDFGTPQTDIVVPVAKACEIRNSDQTAMKSVSLRGP